MAFSTGKPGTTRRVGHFAHDLRLTCKRGCAPSRYRLVSQLCTSRTKAACSASRVTPSSTNAIIGQRSLASWYSSCVADRAGCHTRRILGAKNAYYSDLHVARMLLVVGFGEHHMMLRPRDDLDGPIPGSAAGWSIPLRASSAVRSHGRAAGEPSCV
jgi:hypothetical protein